MPKLVRKKEEDEDFNRLKAEDVMQRLAGLQSRLHAIVNDLDKLAWELTLRGIEARKPKTMEPDEIPF